MNRFKMMNSNAVKKLIPGNAEGTLHSGQSGKGRRSLASLQHLIVFYADSDFLSGLFLGKPFLFANPNKVFTGRFEVFGGAVHHLNTISTLQRREHQRRVGVCLTLICRLVWTSFRRALVDMTKLSQINCFAYGKPANRSFQEQSSARRNNPILSTEGLISPDSIRCKCLLLKSAFSANSSWVNPLARRNLHTFWPKRRWGMGFTHLRLPARIKLKASVPTLYKLGVIV